MFFIPDQTLDQLIAEDVPYLDLTTWAMGIGRQKGSISYFSREEALLCSTEEAVRIFEKFHITVEKALPSGSRIAPGEVILSGTGRAEELHMAWKVCQNLLDHCSGIATKTRRMLQKARSAQPDIVLLTTRKGFPGTKALATKAILVGGAYPHRLGVSETVLVFKQHMAFSGGLESFLKTIPELKKNLCEKKLIVEADSIETGIALCAAGADGIQFDKLSPGELRDGIPELRRRNTQIALLAAGGINESNISEYASTGVDALVTTDLYGAAPIDIGVKMEKTT